MLTDGGTVKLIVAELISSTKTKDTGERTAIGYMEKGHLEASPLHVATTEKESEVEGSENGGEDSYQQRLS